MLFVEQWRRSRLLISLIIVILYLINDIYCGKNFNNGNSSQEIPSDEEVVIKREVLAGRQIFVYRSYKDVQIFHFMVPQRVSTAIFNLTANDSRGCDSRAINVFLQSQSYPVVNPNGEAFPPGLWLNRLPIYSTALKSDLNPVLLTVRNPRADDWYMIAYVNDSSNRITQAGLFPSCHSWLQVEVIYNQESVITIAPASQSVHYIDVNRKLHRGSQLFRVYAPSRTWTLVINVTSCQSMLPLKRDDGHIRLTQNGIGGDHCPLLLSVRPMALPDILSSDTVIKDCSATSDEKDDGECLLRRVAQEEAWHYISITTMVDAVQVSMVIELESCDQHKFLNYHHSYLSTPVSPFPRINSTPNETKVHLLNLSESEMSLNSVLNDYFLDDFNETEISSELLPVDVGCWKRHQLVKRTFAGNFVFEFDLPPDENGSIPLMLNISNFDETFLTFSLKSVMDIGGTMSVELAVSPFMNVSAHNFTVIGCLSAALRAEFVPGHSEVNSSLPVCSRGHQLLVNTSSLSAIAAVVLVPFPEPGMWHLTLKSFCYVNTSTVIPCHVLQTTMLFSITSSACLQGKCGQHGSCYQYISGGSIFSTCVCDGGYRGWGCTDASQATPNWMLLLATLLLTLSNLFFVPAIVLAMKRRYYAEATVYTFTMFFSTFYHACDQETYSFCMMRASVLQFCDFYSAILSFWVTLIAMADLPHSLYSVLHVAGAMVVALGVEYDRTGLWVFVIPAASAFGVMAVSWTVHCHHQRECYPNRRYWLTCLLPGVLLAATGLVAYALFETEENYLYVHSAWHAVMALSILCILPSPRINKEKSSSEESEPLSGHDTRIEVMPYSPTP